MSLAFKISRDKGGCIARMKKERCEVMWLRKLNISLLKLRELYFFTVKGKMAGACVVGLKY